VASNSIFLAQILAAVIAGGREMTLAELKADLRHALDDDDAFVSDAEVEEKWRVKPGYCQELRASGRGPKYYRLSPRVLRYRRGDLREFEDSRAFLSLADELARDGAAACEGSGPNGGK
jgi:hypothetical protein